MAIIEPSYVISPPLTGESGRYIPTYTPIADINSYKYSYLTSSLYKLDYSFNLEIQIQHVGLTFETLSRLRAKEAQPHWGSQEYNIKFVFLEELFKDMKDDPSGFIIRKILGEIYKVFNISYINIPKLTVTHIEPILKGNIIETYTNMEVDGHRYVPMELKFVPDVGQEVELTASTEDPLMLTSIYRYRKTDRLNRMDAYPSAEEINKIIPDLIPIKSAPVSKTKVESPQAEMF